VVLVGHINPGIAIANKIKKENVNAKIVFVGTTYGIEKELVPKAGYQLKFIRSSGISKKINIQTLKSFCKIALGIKDAFKLIKEFKPDVVIGTGGYVSAPVLYAASKKKIPTFIHESNAFPGKTVKFLSSKVDEVLVGFEETKKRLPKAKKVTLVGNPTKVSTEEISHQKRKEIFEQNGLKEGLPVVLVFGGSQGAKSINDSIVEILSKKQNKKYQIIFAPGPKQYEIVKDKLKEVNLNIEKIENCKITPYIYNMEEIMKIADLVICRSGAMTITELGIVGVPAILIPFPHAAENHQEYNARVLENQKAGKVILDKDLNAKVLNDMILELIKNPATLKEMGNNAKKYSITNSEEKIYNQIISLKKHL